ncbi:pyruvate dehydrogenase complex dihydrolipoamide acetyltransferase [Marinivivus vitaminiproducens]|uniref:pyruvate dehydrogenase complex dihydrolipoamide acetyltransferase n=1 Tax=Marinivivus vitaminiproducens TaxID=3035935 RepID=UPI0027AA408A|nr:pyruvate dehydrogenase complex dihydrolipoamide acetyltransferase [Geminicoccaceae bacterium SCSIO 64248]
MPIEILMPALSPTMTEGNLATWHKQPGDEVKAGDVIAEIETDKATMEVEAVDEGKLGKILIDAGAEGVAVNTPIALLLEEGEDESALESYGGDKGGNGKSEAKAEPAVKPDSEPAAASKGYGMSGEEAPADPAARKDSPAPAPKPAANGHAKGDRVFASPLARRLAEQAGLDLASLKGSGPHGRIVKRDVEAAASSGAGGKAPQQEAAPAEAKAPVQAPAPAAAPPPPASDRPHEEVKLNNMRKTIARRLTEAKQTVPHFYLDVDIEIDALLALRKQLNERPNAKAKLSVNDFVIKASALALRDVPDSNACWGGDKILKYNVVDLSIAVALDGGLITPVIRDADQKSLSTLSTEMKALAEKARAGKLKPEEYQGGSFSISNLGMYGVKSFAAVINPPQGSILAVGAGEQRAVVKGGELKVATVMSVCLSVDHRVVDGALGAEWLKVFKAYVEDPMSMLV